MKRGFIRGLWGIFDNSHRITNRRFRVEKNIKDLLLNKNNTKFVTYVFGIENFSILDGLGVKDIVLVNNSPFQFDLVKHQYRHKMEIIKKAMEEDGFDEVVYLDWDCIPTCPLPNDFWETLGKKDAIQANLIQYHRKKCFWRQEDQRKVPNGGFLYIRDKTIPSRAIKIWETIPQDNDEVAWAKLTDEMMGEWKGIETYWDRFEPMVCDLHRSSPYSPEKLKEKKLCFRHFQGVGR